MFTMTRDEMLDNLAARRLEALDAWLDGESTLEEYGEQLTAIRRLESAVMANVPAGFEGVADGIIAAYDRRECSAASAATLLIDLQMIRDASIPPAPTIGFGWDVID